MNRWVPSVCAAGAGFFLLALSLAGPRTEAEVGRPVPAPDGWETSLPAALEQARKESKPLFLVLR